MQTAHVIYDKATGKAVLETYNPAIIDKLNRSKYDHMPVIEWLQKVNREAKATK